MNEVKNAGKYRYQIAIYQVTQGKDNAGFPVNVETLILSPYADVKTTRGYTLIKNDSDFEKALTNFTIRYPQKTEITRDMIIKFRGKTYTILYLNNINEANVELEIQAKEVTH
jgi:SPP1 family predicted phage head-tail adaptor